MNHALPKLLLVALTVSLVAPVARAFDGVPADLSFQGKLVDVDGKALDGPVDVAIAIYPGPEGGEPVYAEIHRGVPLADGVFSLLIGRGADPQPEGVVFGPELFRDSERWIEVIVDPEGTPEVLEPRQPFSASPYAFQSAAPVRGWQRIELRGTVAPCPEGKVVIGGSCRGCQQGSRPDVLADGTHMWRCNCTASPLNYTTYAICADAAPVCGDGRVNQPHEECDGFSAEACTSVCLDNCTCEQCGDGVCAAGEDCSSCPGDCGACVPLWGACPEGSDPSKICIGGACIQDVCRPVTCSLSGNANISCMPPPGFSASCVPTGTFAQGRRCILGCDDLDRCPNDLVCGGTTCVAP